jgi:ribosomal protein S18 acetylase RimI-like enzyme
VTKSGLRSSLGPHVVGQRIVVRRVLPGETGPTGGPAMTDVLGTCESWEDGLVSVRREDGTVVEIRTADIVSGKPVPPRPSPRLRVSTRDAESHAAPLWPGVVREPMGSWELRTDPAPVGRLLKRANSCLAIGDPGLPWAEAVGRVVAFYRDRGRDALVQVEADSDLERAFLDAGWRVVPGGDADLLLGSVSRARRLLGHAPPGVGVAATVDGPRVEAAATRDGLPAGVAHAAVDGDWLGVHGLTVDPEHRRHGVATALMDAVLEFGAERGAATLWLHVETDNAPARALYERLGLVVHHTCRYLTAPSSL